MEKLHFKETINASKEKVWKALWDDENYRKWTTSFSPSSFAESDWKEGSKILFIDDTRSGMVSRIEALRPNEYMSFEHLGEVRKGVEDTESDRVKPWAGAHENYTLNEADGKTELQVELDIDASYKETFEKMFPEALAQVKTIAEQLN